MTAAVVILICKALRQPVVLGYLIAGFLVGPHFPFIHTVNDTQGVQVWAEIGVIFLLFALGLEFSFKKLAKVGGGASITAIVEVLFMLGVGYLTGKLFGWNNMDSIFLGGILSISSTTIIVRAFDELGLKGRGFVSLVFGVLIVEDLVAILLMVLFSSLGDTSMVSGAGLLGSTLRLGFFLALWFLIGIYILPLMMSRIRRLINSETALIISIGLCLGMVMVATKAGFSPALGAFVMGSLLAETREGHRIEEVLRPVRDLFAAVFFVSVGMLIDPRVLNDHYGAILLLTLITIVGKFFSSSLGALLAGQSLKNSVQAGLSLAQIGEFSFIIATLGLSLNLISAHLYPIAVAVSAITTFTTPYQIKYSSVIFAWMEKRIPAPIVAGLSRYSTAVSQTSGQTLFRLAWQQYGAKISLNAVMVLGVTLLSTQFLAPVLDPLVPASWARFCGFITTFLLATPFLWAVVAGAPSNMQQFHADSVNQLRRIQAGVTLIRFLVGFALIAFIVSQFAPARTASSIMLTVFSMVVVFFNRFAGPFYRKIEQRFIKNLNDKDRAELAKKNVSPELAPWQAALAEFVLSPDSELVAKPLHESMLKETYGLTLAMIQRGEKRILAPGREDLLLPFDRLYLIGDEDHLARARAVIETPTAPVTTTTVPENFGLDSLFLHPASIFVNKPIRTCGLRDEAQGLIVGLERAGKRMLSPDSATVLLEGDVVWVVGDKKRLGQLKKS